MKAALKAAMKREDVQASVNRQKAVWQRQSVSDEVLEGWVKHKLCKLIVYNVLRRLSLEQMLTLLNELEKGELCPECSGYGHTFGVRGSKIKCSRCRGTGKVFGDFLSQYEINRKGD
jgi:hypothetical protein